VVAPLPVPTVRRLGGPGPGTPAEPTGAVASTPFPPLEVALPGGFREGRRAGHAGVGRSVWRSPRSHGEPRDHGQSGVTWPARTAGRDPSDRAHRIRRRPLGDAPRRTSPCCRFAPGPMAVPVPDFVPTTSAVRPRGTRINSAADRGPVVESAMHCLLAARLRFRLAAAGPALRSRDHRPRRQSGRPPMGH